MKYYKTRNCSECNKELFYSCNSSYNLAKTKNSKCRNCSTMKYANKQSDLSKLLENTLESYYWIGFILADGHIEKETRLVVTLAIKDKNHLEKLAKYLKVDKISLKNKQCTISPMDTRVLRKISTKFDIKSNKTENPPNMKVFHNLPANLFKALTIGFIDGDGCIKYQYKRKDVILSVKCHSSWLNILKKMFGKAYIESKGYAISNVGKKETLLSFKEFIVNNNLPVLERKWNKIKK